jgi:hypothetical protein
METEGARVRIPCYYVLIEASGKQSYIFGTNRRRENVGASELIYRIGSWAVEALQGSETEREAGLVPGFDPEHSTVDTNGVQLVSAAGGSVKLLVTDRSVGVELVTKVTTRALVEAPGLDVCGYIDEKPFDWAEPADPANPPVLVRRIRDAGMSLGALRASRPGPETRFLRLPIVDECAVSGLPAAEVREESGEGTDGRKWKPRSLVSLTREDMRDEGYLRLARDMVGEEAAKKAADDVKKAAEAAGEEATEEAVKKAVNKAVEKAVEEAAERLGHLAEELGTREGWVAVIHADANDLGTLFQRSGERTWGLTNTDYALGLRALSCLVDDCTRRAFRESLAEVGGDAAPVLPLVLGGDDLTILCEGAIALRFAAAYLEKFEDHTRRELDKLMTKNDNTLLGRLAAEDESGRKQGRTKGLTACAGVALVKPHFPFSAAYELAEDLTGEAKKAVKARREVPVSALSFHVLYDSSSSGLRDLRKRQTVEDADGGKVRLVAQPYVTTPKPRLAPIGAEAGSDVPSWIAGRHWDDLVMRVAALRATVEPEQAAAGTGPELGERKLPNSQMHDLREALFLGVEVANGRLRRLTPRYRHRGLEVFVTGEPRDDGGGTVETLFRQPPGDDCPVTGLLDAMDAAEFLGTATRPATTNSTTAAEAATS